MKATLVQFVAACLRARVSRRVDVWFSCCRQMAVYEVCARIQKITHKHTCMHVPQLRGHTDPSTWSADSRRRCRVVAGSQSPADKKHPSEACTHRISGLVGPAQARDLVPMGHARLTRKNKHKDTSCRSGRAGTPCPGSQTSRRARLTQTHRQTRGTGLAQAAASKASRDLDRFGVWGQYYRQDQTLSRV